MPHRTAEGRLRSLLTRLGRQAGARHTTEQLAVAAAAAASHPELDDIKITSEAAVDLQERIRAPAGDAHWMDEYTACPRTCAAGNELKPSSQRCRLE